MEAQKSQNRQGKEDQGIYSENNLIINHNTSLFLLFVAASLMITSSQVWVRRDQLNATKHRVSISHLASGKCALKLYTGRDY
jgi:hypothetical protein